MAILHFRGEYDFLSNFYNSEVTYDGITYDNNEAAFQAMKTMDLKERKLFSHRSPSSAKLEGRQLRLRTDWEEVKENIMHEIVLAKFTQNKNLGMKLLLTGDEELVEGTTGWHDNIWGNCDCTKCKNIIGQNKLGKILMRVREELKDNKFQGKRKLICESNDGFSIGGQMVQKMIEEYEKNRR